MLVLVLPRASSGLWFSCGLAVSMGQAAKPLLFACFQLWKLAEVSHEMLILVLPPVSSRVSGFLVASPCLWGKRQSLSFSRVSNCGKLAEVSHEMIVLVLPPVSSRVSMVEAAKSLLFKGFQAGCHVVLRAGRGTL